MKKILVTGGAGFVGANLAIMLKFFFGKDCTVLSLDNLKRRGAELNLPRLKENGVEFLHGDIRLLHDFDEVGKIDLIIECSAEPSVLAGYDNSPMYLMQTNLVGTINCLEFARVQKSDFIFLSTSRVYPLKIINEIQLTENESRFKIKQNQDIMGVSSKGFSERLSLEGSRSLYGTTKLCSELIIQEYGEMYGIRAIINRCGVLTGPWQMGKVDQGVIALKHLYNGDLSYIGYGGTGKQVRDILHIKDLFDLLILQIEKIDDLNGQIFNVGGGNTSSVSLFELTKLCQEITGNRININSVPETRPADIPLYITDNSKVTKNTGWEPKTNPFKIIEDIYDWISNNRDSLRNLFM